MKNNKLSKQRSCIGCQKKEIKSNFWRIIFDGKKLLIDQPQQNTEGRGCYLCQNFDCLEKAIKRNAFNYRLKKKISKQEVERFGNEIRSKLKAE
ncbi:MAG TPA: YlxR family protein [bacterium]|nr:YlxR family protein [bacterium]